MTAPAVSGTGDLPCATYVPSGCSPLQPGGSYRIEISGELSFMGHPPEQPPRGTTTTPTGRHRMRIVNAIPAVAAGIRQPSTQPLIP